MWYPASNMVLSDHSPPSGMYNLSHQTGPTGMLQKNKSVTSKARS